MPCVLTHEALCGVAEAAHVVPNVQLTQASLLVCHDLDDGFGVFGRRPARSHIRVVPPFTVLG